LPELPPDNPIKIRPHANGFWWHRPACLSWRRKGCRRASACVPSPCCLGRAGIHPRR